MQTHTTVRRRNRVYKSLHKPLTYLGVERTLFYFVCVGAVGAVCLGSATTLVKYNLPFEKLTEVLESE